MLRRLSLLLGVALLVGLARSGATLAAPAWTTWPVTSEGFKITIPSDWFLVPNTVTGVDKLITQAKDDNDAGVAQIYASLIATSAERSALSRYDFQAFAYSTEPIFTDVTVAVGVATSAETTTSGLEGLAESAAHSFTAQGWKVETTTVTKIPSGHAAFLNGTYSLSGSTADFAVYVIAHGTHLYDLSFRADARAADIKSLSATIASIADRFAFS